MTVVKGRAAADVTAQGDEVHVAGQMGRLMRSIRTVFAQEDWDGLRQSHFRMLYEIPPDGITITELGERLGMTKQASGQFVTHLTGTGHVRVRADPDDRRSRIVVRTALGDRTTAAVVDRILRIEQEWAQRVGPKRYAAFRQVLDELAAPD
jgi:DNA-binding MarR family transcriptional regulator